MSSDITAIPLSHYIQEGSFVAADVLSCAPLQVFPTQDEHALVGITGIVADTSVRMGDVGDQRTSARHSGRGNSVYGCARSLRNKG
ncbi:hypothetical protein ANAPC5_01248 [Anaplasma phagocytophilum]|nr:hypothetical protein ANAPC5_01248 [Anaplasma phagocytophilum]